MNKWSGISGLLSALVLLLSACAKENEAPSIIVLLPDDQVSGSLSCYDEGI